MGEVWKGMSSDLHDPWLSKPRALAGRHEKSQLLALVHEPVSCRIIQFRGSYSAAGARLDGPRDVHKLLARLTYSPPRMWRIFEILVGDTPWDRISLRIRSVLRG